MRSVVSAALQQMRDWAREQKSLIQQQLVLPTIEWIRAWVLRHIVGVGLCYLGFLLLLGIGVSMWSTKMVNNDHEALHAAPQPLPTRVRGSILEVVTENPDPDTPRP